MNEKKKMDEKLERAIIQMKNGDEKGFNTFYSMTYNQVYFKARQIMKNEEDALDLTQETYVIAYKSIKNLENNEAVYAWLSSITYNQGMKIYKKNKDLLLDEDVEDILGNMENEDEDWNPENANEKKEVSKIVGDIITELPETQKAAIIAFYYDHMKIDQIAECFECSANTVKSRLNYAKKFLKTQILEHEKLGGYALHQISAPVMVQAIEYIAKDKSNSMAGEIAQNVFDQVCNGVGLEATKITTSGAAGLFGLKLLSGTAAKTSAAGSTAARVGLGVTAVVIIGGTATLPHFRGNNIESTETQEPETQIAVADNDVKEKKKTKKKKETNNKSKGKKKKSSNRKLVNLDAYVGTYYMEDQDFSSFSAETEDIKVAVRITSANVSEGKSVLNVTEFYAMSPILPEGSGEDDEREVNAFAEIAEYKYEGDYESGKEYVFNSENGVITLLKNGNIKIHNQHIEEMTLYYSGDLSVQFPYEEPKVAEEAGEESTEDTEISEEEKENTNEVKIEGTYSGSSDSGMNCKIDVHSSENNLLAASLVISEGENNYTASISSNISNEKVVSFASNENSTGEIITGTIQFTDDGGIILNFELQLPEKPESEENENRNLSGKNIFLKK